MDMSRLRPNGDPWLRAIFAAQAVKKGGVIRRSVAWVEAEIGSAALVAEVKRRGFHMFEIGGQYVIVCNHGALRVIC